MHVRLRTQEIASNYLSQEAFNELVTILGQNNITANDLSNYLKPSGVFYDHIPAST